jgi:hypothetical protein
MRKTFFVAVAFFLGLAGSIAAADAAWMVTRSSGQVWIGNGAQKVSLRSQADLPNGATLTTGANGRVMLTRSKEVMTIGPNAVVTIPADNMFGFTTILQYAGEVEFDVEKRNVRHFEVETPFLAAVVKGTHFVVRVNQAGTKVSVSRGIVGVGNSNGQHADITPGQSAQVLRGSTGMVIITGKPTVQTIPTPDLAALLSGKTPVADDNGGAQGNENSDGSSSTGQSSGNDGGSSGNTGGSGNSGHGGGNSGSGGGNSGHGGDNSGHGGGD